MEAVLEDVRYHGKLLNNKLIQRKTKNKQGNDNKKVEHCALSIKQTTLNEMFIVRAV